MEDKKEQEKQPENELEKCRKEKDEYLDGWKRARAELINYKKDETRRFESLIKSANEAIIKEFLAVLDSFDLATAALEKEGKAEKGVYMIRAQLGDVLKNYGLEKLIVSVGQKFDPALQEAIAVVESEEPSGTIVDEVEPGYTLNGKLIRPARVKVSK